MTTFTTDRALLGLAAALVGMTALSAAPALAQSDPLRSDAIAHYRGLDVENVRGIERDLIWVGATDAVSNGAIGRTDVERIRDFEAANGFPDDGILRRPERRLLARLAEDARIEAGYEVVRDTATGVRFGLPRGIVGGPEEMPNGRRWSAPDGSVRVRTYALPGAGLRAVYLSQMDLPGREVTYEVLRDDFFVVAGEQGGNRVYVRGETDGAEVRAFSVVSDPALGDAIEPVIVAMSDDFDPFPGSPARAPRDEVAARAPDGCGNRIRVRRGDTFYAIALRCSISVPALERANPDADPRGLRVGQVLRVPSRADVFPPAPRPPRRPQREAFAISLGDGPVRVGGSIEVSAEGFRPNEVVEAGFGRDSDRFVVTRIARADRRGRVVLDLAVPDRLVPGDRVLVAFATPDGARGGTSDFFTVRRPERRRDALAITGMLTSEGERCPALRDVDGRLYTLAGRVPELAPGTPVRVEALRGTRRQGERCGQGETVEVEAVARR